MRVGDVLPDTRSIVAASAGSQPGRTLMWLREQGTGHVVLETVGDEHRIKRILLETNKRDCAQAIFEYERERLRVRIARGTPMRGGAIHRGPLPFKEYRIKAVGERECRILSVEHLADGTVRHEVASKSLSCYWSKQEALQIAGRWLQDQWDAGYHAADFRIIGPDGRTVEIDTREARVRRVS